MGISARQNKSFSNNRSKLAGPFTKPTDIRQTADWRRIKELILIRDNYICQRCGAVNKPDYPTDVAMTVDHIIPVASGGKNLMSNLITLCAICHSKKLGKKNKRGKNLLLSLQARKTKKFGGSR
jgi:5-methylcytosine-specific restriction endonuclease McrA